MQSVEMQTYKRLNNVSKLNREKSRMKFGRADVMRIIFSFLLGRSLLFGSAAPFLLSYYTVSYRKEKTLLNILASTAGLLTAGMGVTSLKYIIAMMVYSIYMYIVGERIAEKSKINVLMCGLSVLCGGGIFIVIEGFGVYNMAILVLESIVAGIGVQVISIAIPFFDEILHKTTKRKIVLNSEFICIAIFFSVCILGLDGTVPIPNFSIANFICIASIMMFSFMQGITLGTMSGVIIGFIIGVGTGAPLTVVGIYGFCGFVAGAFNKYGKLAVAFSFLLASLVMTLYVDNMSDIYINFYEILAAGALFFLMPTRIFGGMSCVFENGASAGQEENEQRRVKKYLVEKLDRTSRSFAKLSSTFSEISERRLKNYNDDIGVIFNDAAQRVCKSCSMFKCCWEREFNDTYKSMFRIIEKLEEKGYIDVRDVESDFSRKCIHIDDLVVCVNHLFEIYKLNIKWANDLLQNRQLVSQQYKGISKIVDNMSCELSKDITFQNEIKNKIMAELDKSKFKVYDAGVIEIGEDRFDVDLEIKAIRDIKEMGPEIAMKTSCLLNRPMVISNEVVKKGHYYLKLSEADYFDVKTGVASATKDGCGECGDSYSFLKLDDGRYIMAMSDGMGSGRKAARESQATISLLEQFLDSGFDKETTFGLINSVLVLKSAEESFATIDLGLVNLISGVCEFVKIGSATSFIRKLDRIETIYSTSLPAGILTNIDVELSAKNLDDGDLIIMMSDGILDSDKRCTISEKWVIEFLEKERNVLDPQVMADKLLKQAVENCGGELKDDMTVMVARVVKKIS